MKSYIIPVTISIVLIVCLLFIYIDNTKRLSDVLDKHSKMLSDSLRIEINELRSERIKIKQSIDSLQKTIDQKETDLFKKIKDLRNGK
jgi:cell division protein FtsB